MATALIVAVGELTSAELLVKSAVAFVLAQRPNSVCRRAENSILTVLVKVAVGRTAMTLTARRLAFAVDRRDSAEDRQSFSNLDAARVTVAPTPAAAVAVAVAVAVAAVAAAAVAVVALAAVD